MIICFAKILVLGG